MKKLIALTIVLSFVLGIPVTVLADDSEFKNASQYCVANDDLGYSSHGQCVRVIQACYNPGNSGPVCACRKFLDNDPQGFYEMYNSLDDCISHLWDGYISE